MRLTATCHALQKKDKGFQGDAKRKESKVVRPPDTAEYVVQGNETLAGIALKHNVPAPLLVKVNMLHTSAILPGQVRA
jgi:LysM repeat protein